MSKNTADPTHELVDDLFEDAATPSSVTVSFRQLLLGTTSLPDEVETDPAAWASAYLKRWSEVDAVKIAAFLQPVIDSPNQATCRKAANNLRRMAVCSFSDTKCTDLTEAADRLDFYTAVLGCPEAALHTARIAAGLTHEPGGTWTDRAPLVRSALGWIMHAADIERRTDSPEQLLQPIRTRVARFGAEARDLLTREMLESMTPDTWDDEVLPGQQKRRAHLPLANASTTTTSEPGIVVVSKVGETETDVGQHAAELLARHVGRRLRLVLVPTDLAQVRTTLDIEFPHFHSITKTVLDDATGGASFRIRPIVLDGQSGIGKTSYVLRMLELLDVPVITYSCSGVSDSTFMGTARQWNSAGPCLPLISMLESGVANAAILLDEADKTGNSRHNGKLHDALLGMIEPRTAKVWLDPYVRAEVDLSNLVWVATTNNAQLLPQPIRDRMRVLRVPNPGPEHLELLANQLLRAAVVERGLNPAWAVPVDGLELQYLAQVWRGGSLRALGRLIKGVLDVRDRWYGQPG